MPSPFPGMDPFLEAPDLWPDLHDALAGEFRGILNRSLPAPYYARLEMRPEVGIVAAGPVRRVVPDVSVVRSPAAPLPPRQPVAVGGGGGGGGTAVLEAPPAVAAPRNEVSPAIDLSVPAEPVRHAMVEVRDASRGHALVTLIEIVSPSNKRPGPDRDAYLAKQREVLASDASLIQLDLVRAGDRPLPDELLAALDASLSGRPPDYLVLVDRAWDRFGYGSVKVSAYPVAVAEMLPCIPVPLRKGEPEVPLDLQYAFQRAYDNGPYARGAVEYAADRIPAPPLPPEAAAWAADLLRSAGGRA